MFQLKGRVAVITGASSGLGKQMAKGFASQGADLVIMARRLERLEEAEQFFGKVDILVNCAGSAKNNGVLNMTDEEWRFTMDTDLNSVFYVTREFANIMKKNNYGRIINIASMYGMVGNMAMDTVAYHSSKGYKICGCRTCEIWNYM